MDVDNAAEILAGSILTGLALIIIVITIVIINNIFSKYWKPVQWTKFESFPPRFATQEELNKNKIEPKING
jgi:hypothetical protein